MQSMTLEQLRAASDAGGVSGVTLKGRGGGFFVQIGTRSGAAVVLAKARSTEPRVFGNPVSALNLLRELGILVGQFDATEWNPAEKISTTGNESRAKAMREAHEAAAYTKWLSAEIQASINDPRPSIPHDEVMAEMDTGIAGLPAVKRKRAPEASKP